MMKKMDRRTFLQFTGLAGAAALLAGCGAASSSAAGSAFASGAALSGKVTTGGSTSMENVMSALQEGFAALQPNVDITYDPTGSGAGITGAMEGSLDIGKKTTFKQELWAKTPEGVKKVVLDFGKVGFIDSACLGSSSVFRDNLKKKELTL